MHMSKQMHMSKLTPKLFTKLVCEVVPKEVSKLLRMKICMIVSKLS